MNTRISKFEIFEISNGQIDLDKIIKTYSYKLDIQSNAHLCRIAGIRESTFYNMLDGKQVRIETINAALGALGLELQIKPDIVLAKIK